MSKRVLAIVLRALNLGICAIVFSTCVVLAVCEQLRTFDSREFRYHLSIPTDWHLSVSPNGIPRIFNYSPEELAPQGLFPSGGAEIHVVPLAAFHGRKRDWTESQWVKEEVRVLARDRASIEHIDDIGNPKISNVVRASYDIQAVPDGATEHSVDYYFSLGGQLFHVTLNYWKGDPSATRYEKVLLSILKSIRPTGV